MSTALEVYDRPILLVIDDFELVQALSPIGRPGTLPDLSAYAMVAERIRLSVAVNQIATNSSTRASDLLTKRALESSARRIHFSIASRNEMLPGNLRGRPLASGVAQLFHSGRPKTLIRTLCPADLQAGG